MIGTGSAFAEETASNVLSIGPGQPYATVAAAISAAQPGDTIEVDAAGVYYGSSAYTYVKKSHLFRWLFFNNPNRLLLWFPFNSSF